MTWGRDFEEFAEKLRELAEEFSERAEGRFNRAGMADGQFISPDGYKAKRRIGIGISKAMNENQGIVDEAQRGASRWVTTEAKQSIQHQKIQWNVHEFGATHDLVKYHEFGTGTEADDPRRATVNAPDGGGYVIPIEGYDSLPFGPDQVDAMDELGFQFVVHPGVKARHFMRDALLGNTWLIEERVAEELDKIEMDI